MIFEALQGSQSTGPAAKNPPPEQVVQPSEAQGDSHAGTEESPVPSSQLTQLQGENGERSPVKRAASEGSIDVSQLPGAPGPAHLPDSSELSPQTTRHDSLGERPSSARAAPRRLQPAVPVSSPKSTRHPLAVRSPAPETAVSPSDRDDARPEEVAQECEQQQGEEQRPRTLSEGRIQRHKVRPGGVLETPRHASLSDSQRPLSASAAVGARRSRPVKALPVAKPVTSQISRAAR